MTNKEKKKADKNRKRKKMTSYNRGDGMEMHIKKLQKKKPYAWHLKRSSTLKAAAQEQNNSLMHHAFILKNTCSISVLSNSSQSRNSDTI